MLYSQNSLKALNKAVSAFDASNKDPKAQLIYSCMHMAGQMMASVTLFYDGPNPPKGTFDDVLAIPPIQGRPFTGPFTAVFDSFYHEASDGKLS